MGSITITASSTLSASQFVPPSSIGSQDGLTPTHAYQTYVASINTHPVLTPNRFQLRTEQAKAILKASGDALKTHIEDHYGKPPVTTQMLALGGGSAAWGKHLKNLCKDFGKEAFPVPGQQDLYVAEVAHPTKNTKSILALRLGFDGQQGPISSVAVPSEIEKSAAKQNLLTRRAIDTIENILGKPTDIKRQTKALAYFVDGKTRVASLPQEVRTQFLEQLKATRSDVYPKPLQDVRVRLVVTLWECSGTEERKCYAKNLEKCLNDKNKTRLELDGNDPRLTDQDLAEDLHEVLTQLTYVTKVHLKHSAITHLPPALSKMSKLERIDLHGTKLTNMDSVIALLDSAPLLTYINLAEVAIVKQDLAKLRARCEGRQ